MIAIVDYGMGNLGSIKNMVKRAGGEAEISSSRHVIEQAEKIILPGVGAFDSGMINLKEFGLIELLEQSVLVNKVPILGICLGMQLLLESSEEGKIPGLGWIKGKVIKFKFDNNCGYKVPHMGWNSVEVVKDNPLCDPDSEEMRFYFVHSYYAKLINVENMFLSTNYGMDFASGICAGNIFGVQFHPEKSHRYGLSMFKKFLEM